MFKETFQKVANHPWSQKAMQTIYDTPVEIPVGALLGALILGTWRYEVLSGREATLPVAFSEFSHIVKMLKQKDQEVQPLTRFYAQTNEALMQVFEANNLGYEAGSSDKDFARELEYKVDPAFKIHKLLPDRIKDATQSAGDALQALQDVVKVKNELPALIGNFEGSYDDYHHKVTHTERRRTGTSCNSKGKNCRPTYTTVTVYDYTVHNYEYHQGAAHKADALLNKFLTDHPSLTISEQLVTTDKTEADNEYAIEKSMREELDHKIPDQQELLRYANSWALGSTLTVNRGTLVSERGKLSSISPVWGAALKTAKSDRITTYVEYAPNPDPKEFRVAESAKGSAVHLHDAAARIVDGISFAQNQLPILDRKVKEFIQVALDHKEGDSSALREEILDTAREIYQKNYENGLDVQPFKWLDFLGFTFLGAMGGAAVGAGVDKYLNIKRGNSYDL